MSDVRGRWIGWLDDSDGRRRAHRELRGIRFEKGTDGEERVLAVDLRVKDVPSE